MKTSQYPYGTLIYSEQYATKQYYSNNKAVMYDNIASPFVSINELADEYFIEEVKNLAPYKLCDSHFCNDFWDITSGKYASGFTIDQFNGFLIDIGAPKYYYDSNDFLNFENHVELHSCLTNIIRSQKKYEVLIYIPYDDAIAISRIIWSCDGLFLKQNTINFWAGFEKKSNAVKAILALPSNAVLFDLTTHEKT